MNEDELNDLMPQLLRLPRENGYVEFKHSHHKPEEIGKYLSALANSAFLADQPYGYMVFGVEEVTGRIVGTKFKAYEHKMANKDLELWLADLLAPRINFKIYSFFYGAKELVLFQITASSGQPTFFANLAYTKVRNQVQFLREFPELELKLWQKPIGGFELQYAKQDLSAADVLALLDTHAVFELLLKIPYPTTQAGVFDKLLTEKLVVSDHGRYHLTYLGALLFAKNLQKLELGRKAPRVTKYKGKEKPVVEQDQFLALGYGPGFQPLINHILASLPPGNTSGATTQGAAYPPLAIRELVANALVHQDFTQQGNFLTIKIYKDRLEISNPGLPCVEPNRFSDGHSACNPLLANAMRRMGFGQDNGSGIVTVLTQCEAFQLPSPDFKVVQNQTIATLYAHQDFAQISRSERLRAVYQHCCLRYLTNQKMNNQAVRERFQIDERQMPIASQAIVDASRENLIKFDPSGQKSRKFACYVPYWA